MIGAMNLILHIAQYRMDSVQDLAALRDAGAAHHGRNGKQER